MRTLMLWCPDWPVVAASATAGVPVAAAIAVFETGRVLACSAAARAAGVRRGMRRREAQARCPALLVAEYDPVDAARAFEPVVTAVEELAARVEIVRPGLCAVAAPALARYHGGEQTAVAKLTGRVGARGVDCRAGIADGRFAATLAARAGHVVPPGADAAFLAPFPIGVLEQPPMLAGLLRRLGIGTLGAFAALPAGPVLARFGAEGALAHRLARGLDEQPITGRRVPPELSVVREPDPPVDRADVAAFLARAAAEELAGLLTARGLVCRCVEVEIGTDRVAAPHIRRWRGQDVLTGAQLAERVRWQLEAHPAIRRPGGGDDEDGTGDGISLLRLVPVEIAPAGQAGLQGLWDGPGEPDERAHRAAARLQGLLGHDAVFTAVPGGGWGPGERVDLVPWGQDHCPDRPVESPWPGHLPAPHPGTVLARRLPAVLVDAEGEPVGVTGRAVLTASPARVGIEDRSPLPVRGWAGPWPVEETWRGPAAGPGPPGRRLARLQVVTDAGAWLLVIEGGRWWVEAVYD